MKKIIGLTAFIILAIVYWHYALPDDNLATKISNEIKSFASSTAPSIKKITDNISAPPPLKGGTSKHSESVLTVSGVISETNQNRADNGNLPKLKEHFDLDVAAENKLKDLFAQQYFEHISPQGKGPSQVVTEAGYAYISVGENLALGNFKDDAELVTAWMNSPGHRANILNKSFEEIGVAVGQGTYNGEKTWIAVQEFGKPKSSCPSVNSALKTQIDQLQAEIGQTQPKLSQLKTEIDSANPQTQSEYDAYNQKVTLYNDMVHQFNNKVDTLKLVTGEYNEQVNQYNQCLAN